MHTPELTRRRMLSGTGLIAGASMTGLAQRAVAQAGDLKPFALPPPISRAERVSRIARAQRLMRANGIGSVLVEAGPSLDYFTGIQWWRSERLTWTRSSAARRARSAAAMTAGWC